MFRHIGPTELIVLCAGVLALLTFVLAVVLVAWVVKRGAQRRRCPHCGEKNQRTATVCRYCGRDLPSAADEATAADGLRPGTRDDS